MDIDDLHTCWSIRYNRILVGGINFEISNQEDFFNQGFYDSDFAIGYTGSKDAIFVFAGAETTEK